MTRAPAIPTTESLDAVADLGCDRDGDEPIDDHLATAPDGAEVVFPDGRFAIDQYRIQQSSLSLVAADDADPVLTPARPAAEMDGDWMLLARDSGPYALEGFTFDFTREGYGATVNVTVTEGDFRLRDVHARGVYPDGISGVVIQVVNDDAVGVIERFITRDGTVYDSASSGIYVARLHGGTLYIKDSEIWNRASNGVYASGAGYERDSYERNNGPVHVVGGVYKNNNIASIRLGTTGSTCRDVVVHNEADPSGDTWDSREHDIMPRSGSADHPVVNARGIWLKNREDIRVENCDLRHEVGRSGGVIATNTTIGSVDIRDTRIGVTGGDLVAPIYVKAPGIHHGEAAAWTLENVSLTGTADFREGVRVAGRPAQLTDCCIECDGHGQAGVRATDGATVTLTDSAVDVPGRPTVSDGGAIDTRGLSETADCPPPTVTGRESAPSETPAETSPPETTRLDHTVTVRAVDGEGEATYALTATDGIGREPTTPGEATVTGAVGPDNYEDWYYFGGDLASADVDGVAELFVDGDLQRRTGGTPARTVTVRNESAGGVAYRFDVAGDVLDAPASADTYPDGDETRVAASSQTGWTQQFRVRGDVTRVDIPDGIDVVLE